MNKQTKKETYLYTWSDFRVKIAIFHPTKPISVGFFFELCIQYIDTFTPSMSVCFLFIICVIFYCVRWTSNTICLDVAFINSCRRSSSKDEGFFLPFPFFRYCPLFAASLALQARLLLFSVVPAYVYVLRVREQTWDHPHFLCSRFYLLLDFGFGGWFNHGGGRCAIDFESVFVPP